jgi:hypothetical protein
MLVVVNISLCVCVCVCVRAYVRAWVRACVRGCEQTRFGIALRYQHSGVSVVIINKGLTSEESIQNIQNYLVCSHPHHLATHWPVSLVSVSVSLCMCMCMWEHLHACTNRKKDVAVGRNSTK